MKRRYVAAVGVATALAMAATTAVALTSKAEGKPAAAKITVWLHPEAQGGWPQAVAAATRAVQAKHPGAQVDVQSVAWGANTLAKLDASLAAGNAPDVVEMGNTETTKYMAAGAFTRLTAKNYPNSSTWLKGLTASCQYNGKLYCVPYYAGARAVIYRTDLYRRAGIKGTPKTLAQFVADGRKLMKKFGKNKNFSAYYHPGKNWYVAMSFVEDYGGQIAVRKGGKWHGALNSPKAIRALTVLKSIVSKLSRASKTTDESHPYPSVPTAQGLAASYIGNGWELPMVSDPKFGGIPKLAPVVRAYPMPSHIRGRYLPAFLGGSDLAIPVTSKNKAIARDWIKAFTTTAAERAIAKPGNIANTTKLAGIHKNDPKVAPFAEAAKFSWFVPTSPNWPKVESSLVLQNMMVKILTGRASVKSATTSASKAITSILNSNSS
jgi:N,N'-diacetylchitobiose transport system substrate-binding protein